MQDSSLEPFAPSSEDRDLATWEPAQDSFYNQSMSEFGCYRCGEDGHRIAQCPKQNKQCFACKSEDHQLKDCPLPESERDPLAAKFNAAGGTGGVSGGRSKRCYKCASRSHLAAVCTEAERLCFNCKQSGHESRDCTEPRQVKESAASEATPAASVSASASAPAPVARERQEGSGQGQGQSTRRPKQAKAVTCYRCNETGHFARDCSIPADGALCYGCHEPGHIKADCPAIAAQ